MTAEVIVRKLFEYFSSVLVHVPTRCSGTGPSAGERQAAKTQKEAMANKEWIGFILPRGSLKARLMPNSTLLLFSQNGYFYKGYFLKFAEIALSR
jgi:hypothetical protein